MKYSKRKLHILTALAEAPRPLGIGEIDKSFKFMHNTIKALLKEGAIIEADNRYVITSAGKEVIDGVKKMGNLKQTHQKPRIKTN